MPKVNPCADPVVLERRRRQRDLKRMSRLRKKMEIEDMQERVRALEAHFRQLCDVKMAQITPLHRNYLQTMHEIETLRDENAYLKSKIVDYDRFSSALENYLDDFHGRFAPTSFVSSPKPLLCETITFEPVEEAEAECVRLMQECYAHIDQPAWRGQRISSGAEMLGWRDERFVDGTALQFRFSKCFPWSSFDRMVQYTWEMMTTLDGIRKIQSSVLDVVIEQRINDDVVVVRRLVDHDPLDHVVAARFLLFRVRTDTGVTIAYKSIPPTASSAASSCGKRTKWVDTFQWFRFEQHSATSMDQCRVLFGGQLDNHEQTYVSFFLLEIVSCIVRWENVAACSMLTFPSALPSA